MNIDWQALEAAGTVGTFAWGLVLFRSQQKDRRAEQASKVSVVKGETMHDAMTVEVLNGSDQPIYDVFPIVPGYRPDCPPSEASIRGHGGAQVFLADVLEGVLDADRIGVQFMDSANRQWTRLPDGRLIDRTRTARLLRWAWNLPDGTKRQRIAKWAVTRYGERFPRGHNEAMTAIDRQSSQPF